MNIIGLTRRQLHAGDVNRVMNDFDDVFTVIPRLRGGPGQGPFNAADIVNSYIFERTERIDGTTNLNERQVLNEDYEAHDHLREYLNLYNDFRGKNQFLAIGDGGAVGAYRRIERLRPGGWGFPGGWIQNRFAFVGFYHDGVLQPTIDFEGNPTFFFEGSEILDETEDDGEALLDGTHLSQYNEWRFIEPWVNPFNTIPTIARFTTHNDDGDDLIEDFNIIGNEPFPNRIYNRGYSPPNLPSLDTGSNVIPHRYL